MERERERFTALGKGRERYGHDDGEVDSPVKIQAWLRASMRHCSSNTDDLLRSGSVFEHGLWCHRASSLGMRREVKMRRGWEREVRRGKFLRKKISENWSVSGFSSNGHNYAECWWDNALVEGPTEAAYLRNCHWVMDDQIWKQVKSIFIFGLHHSVFWVIESPKQDDQNQVMESKQNVFRGSHQFWMMSDEFWIISLKTHCIQTTPK